ncbi:hypothetical protein BKCO1_7200023 [Neofusicoccum parvum]|uniref:Uncharacterized protein n=1 Tax=Neofusicoccum parvum TaxID=310453 RepID=A0ACB5SJL2_9PEZI|nr:hypothetical protein BKCO1_7200023 [Neofusicoccum parvum]
MCVIEQRTYVQPNGRKETFEHVKSRCHLAGTGKTCRQTTYEERTMQGAGHSRLSPRVRYADESSLPSPATESFPPTPVDGATVVEVTPTSAGFRPHSSPKHHRKSGSYGKIVFDFGGSKKEKTKTRTKKYHGSSAASEATSSSSVRSFSPAPPSPLSATHEANLSPTYQYSHRRSYSATVPSSSIPFSTPVLTPISQAPWPKLTHRWGLLVRHAVRHLRQLLTHLPLKNLVGGGIDCTSGFIVLYEQQVSQ